MKKVLILLLIYLFFPVTFASAQYVEDSMIEPMCINLLKKWNDALNDRNLDTLATVYGSVVVYHQEYLTAKQVRDCHEQFFKNHPYYHQFYDNVSFHYETGCNNKIRFDKHVQTIKNGAYTTYESYLDLGFNDYGLFIIGESDATTDENFKKLDFEWVNVDNTTPLDEIFCEANVNKRIKVYYDDLVNTVFEMEEADEDDEQEGPLAALLMDFYGTWRCRIDGIILRDFNGEKGTYYCGGFGYFEFLGCGTPTIFVYNPKTKAIGYGDGQY